ncbi:hypothetical protein C5167_043331 [Papaver somniferum]|uniref:RRM domain-containing protein n=1 Tax=Papaver somniferum TaxID=3469 RepID=A0A4Y7L815_PAPSO|nr:hypothetical protein C5167_043331 [Papaver somniferum]
MSSRASRTLYVGNLPGDIREREVDDLFYKYGPIVEIDLKVPPRPPGYAFVEFEDARDAEDAIRGRDGYNFDGHRLRVELAHGGRGQASSVDRRSSYNGGGGGRGGVSRHSDYRVLVSGLPSSASWQDLKDHMRRAGDVCFSQVFREGGGTTGIVDYTNYDDMKSENSMTLSSEMPSPKPTFGSRSMIPRGAYQGAVADLTRGAEAPSVVAAKAEAGAKANLQRPNLLVDLYLGPDLDPDLFLHGHARDQSIARSQESQQVEMLGTQIWLNAAIGDCTLGA